jgi:predicted small integral membrane protein
MIRTIFLQINITLLKHKNLSGKFYYYTRNALLTITMYLMMLIWIWHFKIWGSEFSQVLRAVTQNGKKNQD